MRRLAKIRRVAKMSVIVAGLVFAGCTIIDYVISGVDEMEYSIMASVVASLFMAWTEWRDYRED